MVCDAEGRVDHTLQTARTARGSLADAPVNGLALWYAVVNVERPPIDVPMTASWRAVIALTSARHASAKAKPAERRDIAHVSRANGHRHERCTPRLRNLEPSSP